MKTYKQDELLALRDHHEAWLMKQTGVTGTGIGLGPGGNVVLRIFTSGIQEPTRNAIAVKLQGIPLAWEEGEVVTH